MSVTVLPATTEVELAVKEDIFGLEDTVGVDVNGMVTVAPAEFLGTLSERPTESVPGFAACKTTTSAL